MKSFIIIVTALISTVTCVPQYLHYTRQSISVSSNMTKTIPANFNSTQANITLPLMNATFTNFTRRSPRHSKRQLSNLPIALTPSHIIKNLTLPVNSNRQNIPAAANGTLSSIAKDIPKLPIAKRVDVPVIINATLAKITQAKDLPIISNKKRQDLSSIINGTIATITKDMPKLPLEKRQPLSIIFNSTRLPPVQIEQRSVSFPESMLRRASNVSVINAVEPKVGGLLKSVKSLFGSSG